MSRIAVIGSLVSLLLVLNPAHAQDREFNWIPSGTIRVGDRTSEGASHYEAAGDVQTLTLAYPGERPQQVIGRRVTGPEQFTIRPASWRGGPATATLVIVRTVDTSAVPGPLRVTVGGQPAGAWHITPPAGERRLHDALFAIPRSLFENHNPPAEVVIEIAGDERSLSLGYRFYATRDWDVLGDDLAGDVQAAAAKATGNEALYLKGLLAEADHDWNGALAAYESPRPHDETNPGLGRLFRAAARRIQLRVARAAALADDPTGDRARPDFDRHYRLGLLAGAWGCWEDALEELKLATVANSTHADATDRLAEAMEYCRLPIEQWAPLYERAGFLGESEALQTGRGPTNVEDVLIAIHTESVEGLCGEFSQESMNALQRDWRYVEQQVYGASRGAWKLRTHFMVCGPASPPWVWQAGWIFLPPDEAVPVTGTYDYSIGTAEFGASHAGGVDCGVSGSGGANIGPTRSWEVLLHEWNHEFDWCAINGEQVPGYPPTHDSDDCGKQPIVSMGCGHRSSMRYYINRAQYRRHEASDPVVSAAFVDRWLVGGLMPVLPAPPTADATADDYAQWLVDNGSFSAQRIDELKRDWENQKRQEEERAAKPPRHASQPPPKPVPDWRGFLAAQWHRVQKLNDVAAPTEAAIINGNAMLAPGDTWKSVSAEPDFVDLRELLDGPDKCVAYARTFVYSPVDQEVRIWFGYNDAAALWLNGRKIHRGNYWAQAKWDDQNRPYMVANSGRLAQGWNCLAVKVERGGGDWGFGIHIVDFENRAVDGLKYETALPAGQTCARYTPPAAGPHYRWEDVRDDYLEQLPRLTSADLAEFTGIPGLTIDPHRFLLTLPDGTQPGPGSRYSPSAKEKDNELNNYLNWDTEAAAALRYTKSGETRDLLLVRPEYFTEFLTLLDEPARAMDATLAAPTQRVLGTILLDEPHYRSVPSRMPRAVLVVDARLPDYPAEDVDLLATP